MKNDNIEITYRNDYVFKSTLKGDDEDSRFLLKFLIEAITQVEYKEVQVVNGELLGEYINAKNSYLDIKALDMVGNIINIEMQQSYINKLQRKRVQFYGSRSVTIQPIKGERYDKLNKVEQIVFTSEKFNSKLYSKFTLREENGNEMEDNLITYHIISLPYIEEIYNKKKELNEPLTDLEVLAYVYYFSVNNDIIKLADTRQKKVLQIMMKKREHILDDETKYDIARAIAYANAAQDADLETAHEIGMKEGYEDGYESGKSIGFKNGQEIGFKDGQKIGFKDGQKIGFKDGQEIGFKDGQEIGFKDGQEIGFKDGQEKAIIEMLTSYIEFKFNISLDLSGLSKEKLQLLKNKIYTFNTYEEMIDLIKPE